MKKLIVPQIIFCLMLFLLIFSAINVVLWYKDNKDISSHVKLVQNITPIKVITVTDNEKKEDYLTADFDEIKKINNEVVGWLNIPNTNVNYPVLQHSNNSYYLNHSFDKTKNNAGWVFMDYRNSKTELENNTIIYGHNRLDGSMFGSLKNLTKKDYLDGKSHVIYLSTPEHNYAFEIFSIYRIDTTDDYIKTEFKNNDYVDWLELMKSRSIYDFKVDISEDDKIITLSTCYKHVKKLVVHAKLVRTQTR